MSEKKFFKLFNSKPNKKLKSNPNKLEYKTIVLLGFGILFLSLSIFTIIHFNMSSENFDSKISEKTDSSVPISSDSPQIIKNNERFGNAISILPDHVQPSVSEPILENYDDVQKPPK